MPELTATIRDSGLPKSQLTCNSDILLGVTELAGSRKTSEKFLFYRKDYYTSKRFGILFLFNVDSTRQAVAIQDTTPSVYPVHRMHYTHYFSSGQVQSVSLNNLAVLKELT